MQDSANTADLCPGESHPPVRVVLNSLGSFLLTVFFWSRLSNLHLGPLMPVVFHFVPGLP